MYRKFIFSLLLFFISGSAFCLVTDSLTFGGFGKVQVYKPTIPVKSVVLFVSGDEGWNGVVIEMANHLAGQGAIVVGINIQHYLKRTTNHKSKCLYPAGDFELLSLKLQKKFKISQYLKPILMGYSAGATLIYSILAQAPANTFKGAISLGFSPDIALNKPLCDGTALKTHKISKSNLYYLESTDKLTAPFIVLQGTLDKVCKYSTAQKFMQKLVMGELISLPNVGHGFQNKTDWLPQFLEAYHKVLNSPSYTEQKTSQNALLQSQKLLPLPGDMPLTLIPTAQKDTLPLVFMISGDGGWTSFDHSLGEMLADKGMPVIGLDAQKYFWNEKTPQETALEISKAVVHYMQQWNKKSFILIGYSFGASIVPFVANRITGNIKESLKAIFSLSPDEKGDFEIHIADMLSFSSSEDNYDVIQEMKKVKGPRINIIFGLDEEVSERNKFVLSGVQMKLLPGNHHYNNNYKAVAEVVMEGIYK
jgi:type IV secretory pathway VirJ component